MPVLSVLCFPIEKGLTKVLNEAIFDKAKFEQLLHCIMEIEAYHDQRNKSMDDRGSTAQRSRPKTPSLTNNTHSLTFQPIEVCQFRGRFYGGPTTKLAAFALYQLFHPGSEFSSQIGSRNF